MKFLFGMILFVGIIVAVLLYMNKLQDDAAAAGRAPVAVAVGNAFGAPPTPYIAPTPLPYVAPPAAPAPQYRPQQAPPRMNAAPQAAANHRAAFDNIARQAGVQIVSYSESPGAATIKVQWSSDNAAQGGDFLDIAMRNGLMRDFDDLGKGGGVDRQGRRIWTGAYRIKF